MTEYVVRPDYVGPVDSFGNPLIVLGLESFDPNSMTPELAAKYEVTDTGDVGANSGRKRFRVVCKQCQKELHWNTTGPASYIEDHEHDGCKSPE